MASQLVNAYKVAAMKGQIAPLTDTIKVGLLTSSFTPNIDTQVFYSDVSANESTGTGYTAGGQVMTSITVTQDNTNDRAVLGAANASWPTSTIADARYGFIYKSTGVSTTSPLIGYIDFGASQSTNGDTFQIFWNTAGVFYLT